MLYTQKYGSILCIKYKVSVNRQTLPPSPVIISDSLVATISVLLDKICILHRHLSLTEVRVIIELLHTSQGNVTSLRVEFCQIDSIRTVQKNTFTKLIHANQYLNEKNPRYQEK